MLSTEVQSLLNGRVNIIRYAERMNTSAPQKIQSFLAEILLLPPGSKVLSIGAGSGVVEKYIAQTAESKVYCLDLNANLLNLIQKEATLLTAQREPGDATELIPVLADAENLPFPEKSFDLIVCSSIIHELASYKHQFAFDELGPAFQNLLRCLRPGGKLVIRDFMQPEAPHEQVLIRVGEPKPGEMDPREFLERFAHDFQGDSTETLLAQIESHKSKQTWIPGATIILPKAVALEAILHYSWHSSYDDEVKEKYAYLPLTDYKQFVQNSGEAIGVKTQVVQQNAEAQAGYDTYTQGRLDLVNEQGDRISLPATTATIVLQRLEEVPEFSEPSIDDPKLPVATDAVGQWPRGLRSPSPGHHSA